MARFETPRLLNRLEPGILDTSPLYETISDRLRNRDRIARNIDNGHLDALAVVATVASTGRATVFIEAAVDLVIPGPDHRKGIDYVVPDGGIRPEHLTASAAVPLLFAPVHIDDCDPPWFVDGGMRLNTPIKPAIELTAEKMVIVATNPACHLPSDEAPGREPADWDDAFLQFLQAAIADPLIEDMYRLARTNTLVEAADAGSGGEPRGEAVERVGETQPITVEAKKHPIKTIPYLFVAPSKRGVFGARAAQLEPCCGPPEMLISKVLGSQGTQHKELLSYVLFDPIFASEAIELGRQHAYKELHELAEQGLDWRIGPIECRKRA